MIAAIPRKMPRGAPFLAFNISVVLFVVLFLLAPLLARFTSRAEEISESAAQLAHFRKIARSAGTSIGKTSQSGDPFLPGSEERIVSADLQASLKAISANAGVSLLGIRGLQGGRYQQLHMVAVSVELEGSLASVRDMVVAIESQTPFLFVTAASFRSVSEGEDGPIRAELKVQGAMRVSQRSASVEAGAK
jgi:general secretion pathway protein M